MSQTTPQPITQNIHKPEWGGAVGNRINWMIGNNIQSAQLRITPNHLGPVDIKISMEKDVVQVSFVSNHQVVRDALESSVPRLKEMLSEENLDLVNVDIGEKHLAEQDQASEDQASSSAQSNKVSSESDSDTLNESEVIVTSTSGLLDLYA